MPVEQLFGENGAALYLMFFQYDFLALLLSMTLLFFSRRSDVFRRA